MLAQSIFSANKVHTPSVSGATSENAVITSSRIASKEFVSSLVSCVWMIGTWKWLRLVLGASAWIACQTSYIIHKRIRPFRGYRSPRVGTNRTSSIAASKVRTSSGAFRTSSINCVPLTMTVHDLKSAILNNPLYWKIVHHR